MRARGLELALDATDEETAFGFALAEVSPGARAIVVDLGTGLRAVKARAGDGATVYVVCNSLLAPLYVPVASLVNLGATFDRRRAP